MFNVCSPGVNPVSIVVAPGDTATAPGDTAVVGTAPTVAPMDTAPVDPEGTTVSNGMGPTEELREPCTEELREPCIEELREPCTKEVLSSTGVGRVVVCNTWSTVDRRT